MRVVVAFHVLFVCSANVCRSPTAAALFRAGMPEVLARTLTVEDAGIAARPGTEMCATAAGWVRAHVDPATPPVVHRPVHLNFHLVAQADLLVALDREVRSALLGRVLGQVPELRQRLFTLVEAAALAEGVAAALPPEGSADRPGPLSLQALPELADERLAWLVSEMDAARGLIRPRRRRHRLGRTTELDVLDAHGPGGNHRDTLRVLDESVRDLVTSIRAVMDVAGVQPVRAEGRRVKR